jgi:hypothetical protein
MAAKKKTTRKKSSARAAVARLQTELPATMRGYTKEVRARLTRLEGQVEKARAQASRRGTKLLREASEYLGRLEARGEKEFRKRRGDAVKLLKRLEKAVQPPSGRKTVRKKAAPKPAAKAASAPAATPSPLLPPQI